MSDVSIPVPVASAPGEHTLTVPAGTVAVPAKPPRLDSIDLLRGVVMIIMALDHVRDLFSSATFLPTDLTQTSAAYFLTRWITHFCAPVFVLLAGTGAFLSLGRGRGKADLSRFLVSRGIWLVFLELTAIKFAWETIAYDPAGLYVLQVIWALGVSMVALAALIHLPLRALAVLGGIMVLGHNTLDGIAPESFGAFAWFWELLHVPSAMMPGMPLTGSTGVQVLIVYPLIPWIGVMALGYTFGALLTREELRLDPRRRRRTLIGLGAALTAAFVVLRVANFYGDPSHWTVQETPLFTALSFLNTTKYPPSLLFLLMTLGPSLIALALFEHWRGWSAGFVRTFGRVPLFYYGLHVLLISALAAIRGIILARLGMEPGWWGGLTAIYLIWIAVVLLLYPLCRWFAGVKARRREVWLSYL